MVNKNHLTENRSSNVCNIGKHAVKWTHRKYVEMCTVYMIQYQLFDHFTVFETEYWPALSTQFMYLYQITQQGFFISRLFFCINRFRHESCLLFAEVFYLSALDPLFSHLSGSMTALFSSLWLLFLEHVEWLLALIVPRTVPFLFNNVSANFTLLENFVDRMTKSWECF